MSNRTREALVRVKVKSRPRQPAPKSKPKHKPGDVWKTDSGFRGMGPKGNAYTFGNKDEADAYAKGKEKTESGKTPTPSAVSEALTEHKGDIEAALKGAEDQLSEWHSAKNKSVALMGAVGAVAGALAGGTLAAIAGAALVPEAAFIGAMFLGYQGVTMAAGGGGKTKQKLEEAQSGLQERAEKEEGKEKKASTQKLLDRMMKPSKADLELAKALDNGKGGIDKKKVEQLLKANEGKKASLRSHLIRVASQCPSRSLERRDILALLADEPKTAAFSLGKPDKKVIDAFLDKKPGDSRKMETDGKTLDIVGMGGTGVAKWSGSKIDLVDLGSRSGQTVHNYIKKQAPANWLKGASMNPEATLRKSLIRTASTMPKGKTRKALLTLLARGPEPETPEEQAVLDFAEQLLNSYRDAGEKVQGKIRTKRTTRRGFGAEVSWLKKLRGWDATAQWYADVGTLKNGTVGANVDGKSYTDPRRAAQAVEAERDEALDLPDLFEDIAQKVVDSFAREYATPKVKKGPKGWTWMYEATDAKEIGLNTGTMIIPRAVSKLFQWDSSKKVYRYKMDPSIVYSASIQGLPASWQPDFRRWLFSVRQTGR